MPSPSMPLSLHRSIRCSRFRWPIPGSMAARRFIQFPEASSCSSPSAFIHMYFTHPFVVVTPIAHINERVRRAWCNAFNLFKRILERMAVVRIAVHRLGSDEPPALAGRRHTDLASKLIAFMGFTFADAFHLRLMNTVDLSLVCPLLFLNVLGDIQQVEQLIVDHGSFSFNIPNDPSKEGAQFPGRVACSFHLAGVSITMTHQQMMFRCAVVVLTQINSAFAAALTSRSRERS